MRSPGKDPGGQILSFPENERLYSLVTVIPALVVLEVTFSEVLS